MLVEHGDDDHRLVARDEVDDIGKAAQQGSTCAFANFGKLSWVLEDAFVKRVQLQYELRSESPRLPSYQKAASRTSASAIWRTNSSVVTSGICACGRRVR